MSDYVPLSVEYGNRRKKINWWLKGRREAFALRLAPWLNFGHGSPAGHVGPTARASTTTSNTRSVAGGVPCPTPNNAEKPVSDDA